MGLNSTPTGERLHIGFFGCRNVGKSSIVNAVTGQEIAVVSSVKGTTTDPVKKSMELLPLGPVIIIDTPGIDDEGELGEKRVNQTKKILRNCDIAILVTVANRNINPAEEELISIFDERKIPYIIVKNKADLIKEETQNKENIVYTSATQNKGIQELKNTIGKLSKTSSENNNRFIGDLIKPNDIVVLVTPIDSSAPKGRMIMPQQLAIRDIIDSDAIAVVTKETQLQETLKNLGKTPAYIITDSQVFEEVNKIVPKNIPLTSFSILMARYKGFLETAIKGAKAIDKLKKGSQILISEGCTHHRQCEDIGTVKLPKWIKEYTKIEDLKFEWSSGTGFPENLKKFDLIIHCGGCMLNAKEMQFRMNCANSQEVPFTNYGVAIAYMKGINIVIGSNTSSTIANIDKL